VSLHVDSLRVLFDNQDILIGDEALFFAQDESRAGHASVLAVVFPRSHQQVLDTVKWANAHAVAIVPSGGRTGLSGGACALKGELVMSFSKMQNVIHFDHVQGLVHVQAGVVIETLQHLALENGWYYPVDYASRGSAQIGGAVATNAGGVRVLRYGMTRHWVLGLKAVTGKGETIDIQRCLVKDNAGYDLKQLLIGSEGTLAIITEVHVQLTRPMLPQTTLMLGVDTIHEALAIVAVINKKVALSAVEFFCHKALCYVRQQFNQSAILSKEHPYYVLLEWDEHPESMAMVFSCIESKDAIIASSLSQAKQLWLYRELISSALNPLRPYKNDIACRLQDLPVWMDDLECEFKREDADLQVVWFGHLGDGNVHINVVKPAHMLDAAFASITEQFDRVIAENATRYNASASAEHGIGLLKVALLASSRTSVEIDYYRAIKALFDPNNILNPGKLLS